MRRTILFLTLLLTTVPAAALELPFEVHRELGSIFVNARVNGRAGVLMVDTGAGSTWVSAALAGINPFALKRSHFMKDVGFMAHGVRTRGRLELGDWSETMRLGAADLTELSQRHGRRVDGIIGQDVLRRFSRVTIDFERKVLLLE